MSKRSKRQSDLINLLLGLVIVVIVNVLSQYAFTRFDLTAEKRYTLTESTREMLRKLDDLVYFKVYLDGDFPQGAGDYKYLREETKIMLNEFRAYGGDNIQYEFIDPAENPNEGERKKFMQQLASKGLQPRLVPFKDEKSGAQTVQYIFPWAIASYHGVEVAVPLMGSSAPKPNEEQINHAVAGLEYELSNAIRKLQMRIKPRIAITQGHGEADSLQLDDLVKGLREYYDVDFVNFHDNLSAFRDTMQAADQIINKYNALLIAGPDSAYSPKELFILDQFVMYGGKVLFLVDPVYTDMDSLALRGMTLGLPRPLGLEELTFRYGARMNTTLVEDLYCSNLMLPVGEGQQVQMIQVPWYYSPTILPREKHPIVANLDPIKFDFLSTIDTVETAAKIQKTILLRSSPKSMFQRTPVRIGLKMAMMERDPRSFNKPDQPVAVLLEGAFDSYYKGKFLPPELKNSKLIGYKEKGAPSKIIVVGDGDVALNGIYKGKPMPLGQDRLNLSNREFYSNKTFLINCMNYLCDDKGLLSVRSREVTLRVLDKGKLKDHRTKWQIINIAGPIGMIILLGFYRMWSRRQKYVKDRTFFPVDAILVFGTAVMLFYFVIGEELFTSYRIIYPLLVSAIHVTGHFLLVRRRTS